MFWLPFVALVDPLRVSMCVSYFLHDGEPRAGLACACIMQANGASLINEVRILGLSMVRVYVWCVFFEPRRHGGRICIRIYCMHNVCVHDSGLHLREVT